MILFLAIQALVQTHDTNSAIQNVSTKYHNIRSTDMYETSSTEIKRTSTEIQYYKEIWYKHWIQDYKETWYKHWDTRLQRNMIQALRYKILALR